MNGERAGNDHAKLEVLEWTATEAIKHIRQGSITAECYVSHLLKRYREWKILNAITWIDESRVLESARAVDAARARGEALGPLAGLPIVVMDMIDTVGYPTTGGTAALKGNYPPRNALVTEILFRNGALLLGKTNMHELGRGVTTSNPAYGFSRNPYHLNHVPGGGPGGTAAAIAARISPAGLGTATAEAGMPAGLCGIVGMRPSTAARYGSWTLGSWTVTSSYDGIVPIAFSVTAPVPMGRTVSDVALLDAIVTGAPTPAAIPLRGARIGVPRAFYFDDLDPEIARISQQALEKLRATGVILVDVNLGKWAVTANATFLTLATMNNLHDFVSFLATNVPGIDLRKLEAGILSRDVLAAIRFEAENLISAEAAEAAMKMRRQLARQYEELFRTQNVIAIVCPTSPVPAPEIRLGGDGPTDTIQVNGKPESEFETLLRNTFFSSVIGAPAVAIPSGLTSGGLPAGLSFYGVAGKNSKLLGLGLSVESALGRLSAPIMRADSNNLLSLPLPVVPGPYLPTPPGSPVIAAPSSSAPAAAQPSSDVGPILALLRQSAYLNLYGSFAVPDANSSSSFSVQSPVRRYDIDFRIDGCRAGICAAIQMGEECGCANLNWTFQDGVSSIAAGGGRNFTMNDSFVFDNDNHNRLRGTGSGRIVRSADLDGSFQVNANGSFVEGTGVFAGLPGSYVITGSYNGSHLNLRFAIRFMDPNGVCQSMSELRPLESIPQTDRSLTSLAFLSEPDPEYPVQRTPTGVIVHELLRAVHAGFDRGRRNVGLRAAVTVGPIIARWRTNVTFNPAGAASGSFPVRLDNVKITFRDSAAGTVEGGISDGRGYLISFPNISGPIFTMTGFGPIASGSGHFRNARGTIVMLAALDLAPAVFSNYYLLQLIDPDGRFRCS